MLDHLATLYGPSTVPPLPFHLEDRSLLLYASSDTITVIDPSNLAVVRVLAFWEAFPSTFNGNGAIINLTVDQDKQLVVATTGSQIAVWICVAPSGAHWRVHSTLAVTSDVVCVDCKLGFLMVGTGRAITEYRLDETGDLPTWTNAWSSRVVRPSLIAYSPNRTHIACASSAGTAVTIYSTRSRRPIQILRQPLSPYSLIWRSRLPGNANRNDIILYTLTRDSTLRVYVPVLDAPEVLQLQATVDVYGFMPDPLGSTDGSHVFPLDRVIVRQALERMLGASNAVDSDDLAARRPLLQQILDDGWDLFARILSDGSMVVRALANIDRRPPTMLKIFTILHTPPRCLAIHVPTSSTHLSLHFASVSGSITLLTSPPFRTYNLSILQFFNGQTSGLQQVARSWDPPLDDPRKSARKAGLTSRISRFERTPEGDAITVSREDGQREIWTRGRGGRLRMLTLLPAEEAEKTPDVVCILHEGRTIAAYSPNTQTLVIKHFPPQVTPPALGLPLEPVVQSIALKTASNPTLFALPPTEDGTPIACATSSETTLIMVTIVPGTPATINVSLQQTQPLPIPTPPELIIPVDPMAWKPPAAVDGQDVTSMPHGIQDTDRDAFVSISPEGELSFWAAAPATADKLLSLPGWRLTGRVRTQQRKIRMAQCSSAKKTVLVVNTPDGEEVTIWDSTESEFSSGMEYRNVFNEAITDLDWTSTNDSISILALGFSHKVLLLCPQRMSYFDEKSTWGVLRVIDIGSVTPCAIGDSVWLADGSLLVGAGHQMLVFGSAASRPTMPVGGTEPRESLFETVARQNGALDEFHPQLILQCLLWNKVDLVKRVITLLAHNIAAARGGKNVPMKLLEMDSFWQTDGSLPVKSSKRSGADFLFGGREDATDSEETFSRDLVQRLTESLEAFPLPHLTPSEMEHLIVLIHTTLEIDEQRRSLDANGVRYLISMRSFFIINSRVIEHAGSSMPNSKRSILAPFVRERIRYRDIVWAFHSESQEILLSASTAACGGKMQWLDARALGIFLWGKSIESLKAQMEIIARNQYMSGEGRDPTACCLLYFALGKVKLVHGLWKQAAWHKEQGLMLKFLSNDFTDPRWKTAALKNAFALLSKQRHEYAAAFFLLGGSLRDAVNVCVKQLADFQLAVAIARVVEGDDGPVLADILKTHVIPRAFREGNRWLGSWAFWMLKRRDMAVRILLTPLRELAAQIDCPLEEIGDPHYDDPSLAVLFAQLKSKSLQTVKGTSEISGQTEFNFVLQMARVLCRMGCHVLALDLVRTWSFDRPVVAVIQPPWDMADNLDLRLQDLANKSESSSPVREKSASRSRPPPSPTMRRALTRLQRSSMIIDMELPSFPPTRPSSPPLHEIKENGIVNGTNGVSKSDEPRGRAASGEVLDGGTEPSGAVPAAPTGFGNLMKTAKKDVVVPEFDMSTFF